MSETRPAGVVAECARQAVASVPLVPLQAAHQAAEHRAHRSTWGTLIAASQDFRLCHAIADLYRDHLGLGPYGDMEGAPPWALAYRAWPKVLADPEWLNIRGALKLAYAVQHGFEPGLWLPSEIVVTAEDRSFRGRLANLGFAVKT